jgi:predicted acetyltransferase
MDIRPVTAGELPAFLRTTEAAFHEDVDDDDLDMLAELFEPARSLAALDGDAIVATTGIYTRELTVPGAALRVAGVSLVGVLPTHRRRGLLNALMRRQLDDVRAAGEPVAALWASEAAIYGRYGYGRAARHATATLRTEGARLAPGVPAAGGRMVLLEVSANLWIRLVDVPAALAARTYAAPLDVVLEVDDAFCPWNAGRHRLAAMDGRAACERTDAAADLALSAADLGAAYLGGTRLAALHAIGRVRELRPGAVERASLAFGTAREPWCPEVF